MHAQEWLNSTVGSMTRAAQRKLPNLVALSGHAGAGKSTVADYLVANFGYTVRRFSDPLKRGVEAMFGLTPAVWEDRRQKEAPIAWLGASPRKLAQTLGTDWGRKLIREDVWLLLMKRYISQFPGNRIVIPDVRFDNEAEMVRQAGGVVLELVRPEAPVIDEAEHASELGVSTALLSRIIWNTKDTNHLIAQVTQALEDLA